MSTEDRDIDLRLERLARATEGVGPSAGFSRHVMVAIGAEQRVSLLDVVRLSSRRFLPVFAVAAVLAILAAVQSETSVDDALASGYATPELEW